MRNLPDQKEVNFKYRDLIFLSVAVLFIQAIDRIFFLRGDFFLNTQLFFGQWGDNSVTLIFQSCLVALIIWFFWSRRISRWIGILLLSGAISNLLDRFFYGGVVDYFDLLYLPRFNLADVVIISGAVLWAWSILRPGPEDYK